MYLGKVIGTVVSTIKVPSLEGSKFLIVEKINQDLTAKKQTEVAVDTVGAGDGETVLVAKGSSARKAAGALVVRPFLTHIDTVLFDIRILDIELVHLFKN